MTVTLNLSLLRQSFLLLLCCMLSLSSWGRLPLVSAIYNFGSVHYTIYSGFKLTICICIFVFTKSQVILKDEPLIISISSLLSTLGLKWIVNGSSYRHSTYPQWYNIFYFGMKKILMVLLLVSYKRPHANRGSCVHLYATDLSLANVELLWHLKILPSDKYVHSQQQFLIKTIFMWDPTSVGEENEAFLIRMWKPLPSKCVLKPWSWRKYVTGPSGQYLLAVAWVVTIQAQAQITPINKKSLGISPLYGWFHPKKTSS